MQLLTRTTRHDPFWDTDGPAARRARRRKQARAVIAFAASLVAVGSAAVAWAVEIGVLDGQGLTRPFVLG